VVSVIVEESDAATGRLSSGSGTRCEPQLRASEYTPGSRLLRQRALDADVRRDRSHRRSPPQDIPPKPDKHLPGCGDPEFLRNLLARQRRVILSAKHDRAPATDAHA